MLKTFPFTITLFELIQPAHVSGIQYFRTELDERAWCETAYIISAIWTIDIARTDLHGRIRDIHVNH